ncbi:hypothetical protein GCM10023264_29380 [Sphingomonas daechungensis]
MLVAQTQQQFEWRRDSVADQQDQLGRLKTSGRLGAVADGHDGKPLLPESLECLVQGQRDPLHENNDWRSARRGCAAHLVLDEGSAGERKQGSQAAGIILLIGSDKSA